jgi:hypothetical protein
MNLGLDPTILVCLLSRNWAIPLTKILLIPTPFRTGSCQRSNFPSSPHRDGGCRDSDRSRHSSVHCLILVEKLYRVLLVVSGSTMIVDGPRVFTSC